MLALSRKTVWKRSRTWLPAAMIAIVGSAELASAEDPPAVLKKRIEDHSVVVRVFDAGIETAVAVGSGLIVADDGKTLTIATAGHVVEAARDASAKQGVEIRFAGRDRWVEGKLQPVVAASSGSKALDVAAIQVDRASSPFGSEPLARDLAISPRASSDEHAWTFGYEPERDAPTWVQADVTRVADEEILFDGDGVVLGFSGGVLISAAGPLGLISSTGARGTSHVAIPYGAIARDFERNKLPFTMTRNAVAESLQNALTRGLTVSLHCWISAGAEAYPFWAAIELQEKSNDEYKGSMVTGERRWNCSLAVARNGVVLKTSEKFGWPNNRNRVVDQREIVFEPTSSPSVSGFSVLSAKSIGSEFYLAIPSKNAELLATRVISAAAVNLQRATLEEPTIHALATQGVVKVAQRSPAFVISMPAHFDLLFVTTYKLHRDKPVTIHGTVVAPDSLKGAKKEQQDIWQTMDLNIMPTNRSSVLTAQRLEWGKPFRFQLKVPEDGLRMLHTEPPSDREYKGSHFQQLLLQNVVIEYASP